MAGKKGNSLLETRRRNRVLIKNLIFRTENATRTYIASKLGLTLPTITTSVNEMMAEGILEEIPFANNDLVSVMGRKPTAIAFTSNAAYAIGVELGPYATRVVLMNMKGEIIKKSQDDSCEEYEEMLDRVEKQVKEFMKETKGKSFLGVGVGLPGFIEWENGIIRSNPRKRKKWNGKHLSKDLEKRLGVPVLIDNNVRLRAVGYEMRSRGFRPDTFAYLYISKGVACPLMVKDDILSGCTSGAGELGQTIISVAAENGIERKIVDDVASERAIFEKCQALMLEGKGQALKKSLEKSGILTMKQILEVQESGDSEINEIISEVVEYLGIALANVVNLINPGFVVVDGQIMQNEKNRLQLVASAKQSFYGLNEEEVQIIFQPLDEYFGAKGAAYFMIRKLFLEV